MPSADWWSLAKPVGLTCKNLRANNVIVAGAVKGNITTEKLEIRSTGRVWGDVVTTAFATEEGAFLRGQVRMEEKVELELEENPPVLDFNPEIPDAQNPTKPVKGRKVAEE